MSFRRFLEAREKQELTVEQAKQLIQEKVPLYNYKTQAIYRGIYHDSPNFFVSTSGTGRRSQGAIGNLYTFIIDNSKDWASFPKRSESFICATGQEGTGGYGQPYLVIPLNPETIMGLCNTGFDIWGSFKKIKETFKVRDLASFVSNFHVVAEKLIGNIDDTNVSIFFKELNTLTNEIYKGKKPSFDNEIQKLIIEYVYDAVMNKNQTVREFLEELFKPEPKEFSIITFKEYNQKKEYGKELWFSGTALLIKLELAEAVFE